MDAPPSSLRRLAAAISAVVVASQESGLADAEVVSEVVTEVVMQQQRDMSRAMVPKRLGVA